MKKVIFCIAVLLISSIAMGQQPTKVAKESKTTQVVKVDNKTFKATNSKKSGGDYKPTGFYYETSKGEKYEIYIHTITRGDNAGQKACYIKRISKKTGKSYWSKINVKPEELK